MEELEVDTLDYARDELKFEEDRRPKLLTKPIQLEQSDFRVQKLKKLI